ncbi:MAG: aspartate aminotransferase family protein [Kiloniellales bacterium]
MQSAAHNPRSAAAYDRARLVMPGGNTRSTAFEAPFPLYIASGAGAYVRDLDGKEYLDLQNNFTALIHGHCHEATVTALRRQLAAGLCFSSPTLLEVELAELLCSRVPYFEQLRFTNTGSEAVMMAVKAARALTGRSRIAKCEGAYHGNYDPVEVSLDSAPENWGDRLPRKIPFHCGTPQSVLDETVVLPFNDVETSAGILEEVAANLAAVVVDLMPSRAGLIPATPAYLRFLRRFTKRHGALLISDEVLNFRLGYQGAAARLDFEPDLCAFGKIIGGGLPVGALAGRAYAMSVFDPSKGKPAVTHAGTFTANPMTMTSGLAAMQAMTPEAFTRLDEMGERVRRELQRTFDDADMPAQVTGKGSLFLIHLKPNRPQSYRNAYRDADERRRLDKLIHSIRDHGVLLSPIGLGALSTAMTAGDVDRLLEAFHDSLKMAESNVLRD